MTTEQAVYMIQLLEMLLQKLERIIEIKEKYC